MGRILKQQKEKALSQIWVIGTGEIVEPPPMQICVYLCSFGSFDI